MAVSDLNFARTFKGKFSAMAPDGVTEYPVMLSCTNDVIFMGRYTSDANKLICTLPIECRPINQTITMFVWCTGHGMADIDIKTDGTVIGGYANATYLMDGRSFNICRNFYG